ncbi:MAG: NAD-dependent epimerase/dehydratase family protein [Gemmatimonadota bacterium]
MPTRRDFLSSLTTGALATGALTTGALAGGILTSGAVSPLAGETSSRMGANLRILILGGTSFLGPHLVRYARERGHQVSIFTRGRREPGMFEESFVGVEHLIGDRDAPGGLAALEGKTWDAVLDTSGQNVRWTRESANLLRGNAGLYLYVSSTGVFTPYRTANIPVDGPIRLADEPPQDPPSYGVMKALSENETRDAFGDGAIVVRPGYIVGPGDPTDRWTYWPVRIARGGEIPVPGLPGDPVQYVDVRDLTEWMIRLLETGTTGTFNATGPGRNQTLAEFVHGVAASTEVELSWTWLDDHDWLQNYPFRTLPDGSTRGFTYSVPWVLPRGDQLGHMQIDVSRARAAGLTYRPLALTVQETLAWRLSPQAPEALRNEPRYVLNDAEERRMLEAWKSRNG